MRLALALVTVLAACGGRAAQGPAWPEMAEREEDGGESLAPRQPAAISIADKDADDDKPAPAKPAAEAAKPAAAKPAAETTEVPLPAPTITVEEDAIEIDGIVIEIEE